MSDDTGVETTSVPWIARITLTRTVVDTVEEITISEEDWPPTRRVHVVNGPPGRETRLTDDEVVALTNELQGQSSPDGFDNTQGCTPLQSAIDTLLLQTPSG